jgi:hypothetical protein
MRMGQAWFARTSGSVFDKVNELNDDKHAWAAAQQGQSHQGSQKLDNVFRSTKLDVRKQVDLELEKASAESVLAVQQANSKRRVRTDDRQSSKRKAFQEGMTTFANFLEHFSGVVEVMKAADEQYGGLAYGRRLRRTVVRVPQAGDFAKPGRYTAVSDCGRVDGP